MYRVGLSNRMIGAPTGGTPDGFVVLNQTNGLTFVAVGGVWAAGVPFVSLILAEWFIEDATNPPLPWTVPE